MAAGRIKGITIEIGGDSTKLVSALAKVDNSLSRTQSNLRDLNRALKLDPGNAELIKDKQIELSKAIEDTKSKLETEKQALEQMRNTEGFDENSRAARDLKVQIDLDTAALKELEAQARQSSSVLGSQMQAAGEKIKEVGEKIKGVGDKIAGIGTSLTSKVTAPIVGAFGASAKAAVDWETAFTGVQKTVDATAEEYEQLASNIKQMSTETASSANEIAGVMEIAGQLGISGVDNLTNFTRTMVELGDTTNLSAEEAATALARFMNITGESTSNVDRIGSAIVDLGNNFATSESEITEMATRLASAGTIAGMSSTDILALSAAMSSVGIQAEAGGTAMTQTLSAMTAAVADFEAGSTDDLEAIANVANMSAQDFANAWNTKPVEAVQAFISGLGSLDEKGENATLVLDELGMSGVRQSNMLKSLALASDVLTDAIGTSTEAYKENSALSAEAEKRYGTMAAKIAQLKNRITEVAVEIGDTLMPYLEKAMNFVEGLVEKWKALDDEHKEAILKFAAIAAAVGPVLIVVGKLVSGVGSIVTVVGSVVTKVGSVISGLGGLSGVLSALTGPVGIAVAAITALVAGFTYLYTTNDEFRASINETISALKENFQNIVENIKPKLEALGEAFKGLMDVLAPVFEFIFKLVVGIVDGIIATIEPVVGVITNIVNAISNIVKAFLALLKGDFEGFATHYMAAIENLISAVQGIVEAFVSFITGFFQAFGVNLKNLFETIWNNVKTVISNVIGNIKEVITTKWTEIKTWLSETLTKIKDNFEKMFDNIKKGVSERITKVKESIVNGMEAAVDYIKSLPEKFLQWGGEMIDNLISGITSKIGGVADAISGVAGTIGSYIHFSTPDVGPLADADKFMPDFMNLLVKGINNGIPKLSAAMDGLTSSMIPNMSQIQGGQTTNSIVLNVYGAQGQNVSELADIIEERITENVMRRGAAFG